MEYYWKNNFYQIFLYKRSKEILFKSFKQNNDFLEIAQFSSVWCSKCCGKERFKVRCLLLCMRSTMLLSGSRMSFRSLAVPRRFQDWCSKIDFTLWRKKAPNLYTSVFGEFNPWKKSVPTNFIKKYELTSCYFFKNKILIFKNIFTIHKNFFKLQIKMSWDS